MSDDDSERPSAFNSADPIRNFTLTVEERIRAISIGVPSWSARKRKIEDDEARITKELVALHDKLVRQGRTPPDIELAILSAATALNLEKLNKLVDSHNKYYPIEANLPMDRKTGGYLVYGKLWEREPPYTPMRFVALVQAAIVRRIR